MLKMASTSTATKSESKVTGKYGTYFVKEWIGSGGNGAVYAAEIIEGGEVIPQKEGYAIKFLDVIPKDEKELEKRKLRFRKEIEEVLSFQNDICGIIPIYDFSIYNRDEIWYLMPKADAYKPSAYTVIQRLEHMLQLGNCLKQLHGKGYAHRDIKPKNLLMFEGKICLSDFGLIWSVDHQENNITEVNDRLGPQAIRPPELQPVEKVDDVDYRKSDVYLFAKTIWMVLKCDNNGFPAEYSRDNSNIYIDKDYFQMDTAEPLHRLLEGATKDYYWERIDMETCITYIKHQLGVIRGSIPYQILNSWKYDEQVKHNSLTIPSNQQIYKDSNAIITILNNMAGIVGLVFTEAGKEYNILPLKKAHYINDNLFEIEVLNPYYYGRKKIIEIVLDHICFNKEKGYLLQSGESTFDRSQVPVFDQIIQALQSPDDKVRLNAAYLIRMEKI